MRRGRRGPGLLGTAVIVGGASRMGARSAQRSQAAEQQEAAQNVQLAELQAQQATPPAVAPVAPAELDEVAQIQKYAALKGQGLLTDEEFEAKKKQILGI